MRVAVVGSAVRTPLLPLVDAAFDPANARECPQDWIDLVRLEFASVGQQNQLRGGRSATADGIGKRQERVSRSGDGFRVAIFATAQRLEPPAAAEGFDQLFSVRLTPERTFVRELT